jgi:hypothetical protein
MVENLPQLWGKANLGQRRETLVTMLDAVYVDTVDEKRIVATRPKPAFRPLLEIATTREGSDIVLVHDDEEDERNGGMEPQKPRPASARWSGGWRSVFVVETGEGRTIP